MPPRMRIGAPLNHDPTPILQWVEVASTLQLPGFHLVGLPNAEVNEARERVRAATEASGFEFPKRRLTLNLSPAYIRKRGTGLDLAIALAVIQSANHATPSEGELPVIVAWAELGLDGRLKPVGQVLRSVYACWRLGPSVLIVSEEDGEAAHEALQLIQAAESQGSRSVEIRAVRSLREAWDLLEAIAAGRSLAAPPASPRCAVDTREEAPPLLPLPQALERLVCVAATGAHHLLLLGPRGTGKTHALDWLAALQPPQAPESCLRHRLIAELREARGTKVPPPIRRVSSQVKPAALLGTATPSGVRPGELSLADGGLVIADEFPEWHRDARECLREPLERGMISLARAPQAIELPARFTLAANGNLCPCGGWPPELPMPTISEDLRRPPKCRCGSRDRNRYFSRLSGPILDRIDLVSLVLSSSPKAGRGKRGKRVSQETTERLSLLRERIKTTRDRLTASLGAISSQLSLPDLETMMKLHPDWENGFFPADRFSLRTRHKILRVALTLAAWDGAAVPKPEHFAEASMYRPERIGLCA